VEFFQKIIVALGIETNFGYAILIILIALLAIITIMYICVPILLLRIRKELIELNKSLRTLYILDSQTHSKLKDSPSSDLPDRDDLPSNNSKLIDEKIPATNIVKLQLEDEDIEKLKAEGFDME
jgi:hypothetical protein